ncbi:MAG: sulfite exporter TauE/SafE family protein [Rhodospirillales bacterium]|nr:MAG: sulfite exporter TauE/SafE family protein [Rhodospirillales bacterium]
MDQLTAMALLAVAGGFVAGGFVKGTTGMGLPLVAVPVATLMVPVPVAVALTTVPILLTNLWQGRGWRKVIGRVWPLLAVQPFAMLAGVSVLAWANPRIVIGLLGVFTILFVALVRYQPKWRMDHRHETWVAILMGAASGFSGGVSSFFGTPIALYLFLLELEKDAFVAAIGVTYAYGAIMLILILAAFGLLGQQLLLWSALATPVAFFGMWLGSMFRNRLNSETFRIVVLVVLLVAGLNLVRRALIG